jgi:DNA polymerase-3 subunit epsilon
MILLVVAGMAANWLFGARTQPASGRTVAQLAGGGRGSAAAAGALVDIASAINQLADAYHRIEHDLDQRSAETRARVEEERDRFAALMSELSQGVLVCNADGRILLYNPRAAALLAPPAGGTARGDYKPLGLGDPARVARQ